MKRFFCLILSLIMAFSVIAGMDVSVFAADTEQVEYSIPRAEYYADNFSDFMIMENSTFADTFLKSLQEDSWFMGEVAVWESLHIAESPADSAERGLITKADYYQTVLFDLIISKKADSALDVLEPIYGEISKSETSFTVNVIQSILEDNPQNSSITLETITSLPLDSDLKESVKSCFSGEEILSDVTTILEIHTSLYDAICTISDYFALKNVSDSTIEVLNYIANDTNNDSALRSAASDCIEHVGYGFEVACKNILDGTANLTDDVLQIYVNNVWGSLISKIPFVNLVYGGIVGGRAMINAVFSEDEKIACYYQLEASVACENALLRAMNGLKTVFLGDKTLDNANYYMKSVDMYKSTVLLGYDYSIELIETMVNCGLNIIIGSYNEAIESINNIRQSKGYKINGYANFEESAFKRYIKTYCPDYYNILKYLDGTYVPITSLEISQIGYLYVGETYSIDDSFSINYLPKNNTEEYMNITITSSDESILKVVEKEMTAVGEGTCILTFVTEDERFCVTKSVTVYEYQEDGYDYLSYFKYSINEDNETVTITDYTGDSDYLLIPYSIGDYKVTHIGNGAFSGSDSLISVIISDSVTSIGYRSFSGCDNLASVTIGNKVTSIVDEAFIYCYNLTSIIISDSVEHIGTDAFYRCDNLTSVYITEVGAWCNIDFGSIYSNPLKYADNLYLNGKLVTDVVIPEGVTRIPECAFSCDSLTSITIPDSVTSMGEDAFSCCDNLTSVYITDIGAWCEINFCYVANIITSNPLSKADNLYLNGELVTDVVIPEGVTHIGRYAFAQYDKLKSVTMPDSVESIGDYAFYSCENLTSVIGSGSITRIGLYAFEWCENLFSISFPDSLTIIGDKAFHGCDKLTSIRIPDNVTSIGDGAFAFCEGLTSIEVNSANEYYCSVDGVLFNKAKTVLVQYSAGKADISYTVPDSVTTIGNYAFSNGLSLNSITIPGSVTSIGKYSFSICGVAAITIPTGVTQIPESAFYCSRLTSIVIPDSVTIIGDDAFYSSTCLTSVIIPDSVTSIGSSAFNDCTKLTTITIPNSVTSIGRFAFNKCDSLEDVFYDGSSENWETISSESYISETVKIHYNTKKDHYDVVSTNFPTCTETGINKYACECGYEKEVIIPAIGHSYSEEWIIDVEATCIKDGSKSYHCTICGDKWYVVTIPSTGHTYGDWVIDSESTCTSVGSKHKTCLSCENTVTETIAYSGHNYSNGVCTVCGCNILSFELNENGNAYSVTDCDSSANGEIVIPKKYNGLPVTEIGAEAFIFCTSITAINIPNSITTINDLAFYYCIGLTSIVIPNSVKTIGYCAFADCSNLGSVTIGDGVKRVGASAFSGCKFTSVEIPSSVESIDDYAFGHFYDLSTEKEKPINGFVIYGKSGTTAEDYAKENGFTFINNCEHPSTKWITDKKATVNAAGKKHKECTECGEVLATATIKQLKCSKPKLSKIENTADGVKITWGKVSGADSYAVYRKTSGGSYKKIGTTSKTYYIDKKATSGKKYDYIVKAVNEAGNSDSSKSLSKLYLSDPTLKTPKSTKKGVTLNWSKVKGADGYVIYYKTGSGSYKKLTTVKGGSKVTYTHTKAKKGKTYTYKIKAYKGKTYSAYSNAKKIKDKY